MDILNDIADMLYLKNTETFIFETDEVDKAYTATDIENNKDLCDLINAIRNNSFAVGFKTATKLWIEVMKD